MLFGQNSFRWRAKITTRKVYSYSRHAATTASAHVSRLSARSLLKGLGMSSNDTTATSFTNTSNPPHVLSISISNSMSGARAAIKSRNLFAERLKTPHFFDARALAAGFFAAGFFLAAGFFFAAGFFAAGFFLAVIYIKHQTTRHVSTQQ